MSKPSKIRTEGSISFVELCDRRGNPIKEAVIDTADKPIIENYRWCFSHRYAITGGTKRNKSIAMHNLLMGYVGVDHKDSDGLNNRRSNLRFASQKDNCKNTIPRVGFTSSYKGVSFCKITGKWRVVIQCDNKTIHAGRYRDEKEAGHIYDQFAEQLFGDFARLNFR